MSAWPEPAAQAGLRARAQGVASRLSLALHTPRGRAGAHAGKGAGASVEIEDHRAFVPGDDPRHVDWNAYGRTGQWVAKTFRAEVSPAVDLVFDASRSMAVFPTKRDRAIETFHVLYEAALRAGAALRVFVVLGDDVQQVPRDGVEAGRWLPEVPADRAQVPELGRVPWRPNTMRIFVSDLLYLGAPQAILHPLAQGAGRAAVLAPRAAEERRPSWRGNLTLVDAETGAARAERFDDAARNQYEAAYEAHFLGYAEAATRLGVALAPVDAEGRLSDALVKEALPRGVFTPWT